LETDLYLPIKRYLEKLGLEVKGEVCGCDLVALSDGSTDVVVIGEMKQSFTLEQFTFSKDVLNFRELP
jgi:hypothetical protein